MASAPVLTNVGSGYTVVTQVVPTSTAEQNSYQIRSPLQKFLKGEPKALGTVQIMIGVMTILFGIVIAIYPWTISVFSGVVFWGPLFHITAGSLAVSGSNKLNSCVVKATMVMSIFSAITAAISIIIISLDLAIWPMFCYRCGGNYLAWNYTNGTLGVLLVFSLLQFAVSIAISGFTCKATCTTEPALNIINVVPNPESGVPMVRSFPAYEAQPGMSTVNAVTMSGAPMERPPAYCEKNLPNN